MIDYIAKLRKFFHFQKEGRTPMQQILGTNTAVNKFANFFAESGDDYALVSAYLINTYITTHNITKKEFKAFKIAHAQLGTVFLKCWQEREAEKLKKNREE